MALKTINISIRLYGVLLFAYPPEFRQEFRDQMLQVFRDCYRNEASSGSLLRFWLLTLTDLVFTAAKERMDHAGRKDISMNRRTDAIALLGCVGIIVIAFLLLSFGRKNDVSFILAFGYVLDALIITGVVGNLIVFLLNKATKFNQLRTALWTFAVVHGALLLFAIAVVSPLDPRFSLGGVVTGYIVSFFIWVGFHFALRSTIHNQGVKSEQ